MTSSEAGPRCRVTHAVPVRWPAIDPAPAAASTPTTEDLHATNASVGAAVDAVNAVVAANAEVAPGTRAALFARPGPGFPSLPLHSAASLPLLTTFPLPPGAAYAAMVVRPTERDDGGAAQASGRDSLSDAAAARQTLLNDHRRMKRIPEEEDEAIKCLLVVAMSDWRDGCAVPREEFEECFDRWADWGRRWGMQGYRSPRTVAIAVLKKFHSSSAGDGPDLPDQNEIGPSGDDDDA